MSETITGYIQAIKSTYVDSTEPNKSFSSESHLILSETTEAYVAFNKEDLDSIPKYAKTQLWAYAELNDAYNSIIKELYTLNSNFDSNTTYNNKPSMTLLTDKGNYAFGTWVKVDIPNTPSQYYNGIGITGDSNSTAYTGVLRNHTDSVAAPRIYYEYKYSKDELILTTTGNSIDNDITVSWTLDNQTKGIVKAYQDGSLIKTINVTTENNVTFAPGSFTTTQDITIEVELYKQGELYTSSKIITNITNTNPVITSLEPSNVQKLNSNPIDITFDGSNITKWDLQVKQNGLIKHSADGTSERLTTIQANVLSNGSATITLNVEYSGNGYTTYATKEVTFNVYGKPSNPVLNIDSVYGTPRPILKWVYNTEQVSYRVVISKGDSIVEDTTLYGSNYEYEVTNTLLNNNIYTITLYIKNEYDLWSDPVSANFEISFAELSPPIFTIYNDDDNARNTLVIESEENKDFYYHEVYRREKGSSWVRVATNVNRVQTVHDNECKNNVVYEYKISAVSALGTYTDSVVKECKCTFHNTHISVANTNRSIILNKAVSSEISYTDDITFEIYDGTNKPSSSNGLVNYATLSVSCQLKEDEFDELMEFWMESLLCLRDVSGLLLYGRITKPKYNWYLYRYQVSFTFTETYNEGIDINGDNEPGFNNFIKSEW